MSLTPKARQHLKANAHKLKPIVLIGSKGLTTAVIKEVDVALRDHELVKIRLSTDDREAKKEMLNEICSSCHAEMVQLIGKIGVVYRKN